MDCSEIRLAEDVGSLLVSRGLTLSVAESCTGGMLGSILTSIAGASEWFLGGVTAYSDSLKVSLLEVPDELLLRHGSVSRAAAEAMASGMRHAAGSDLALSVTGIAGPGGGSDAKPVGTVFMAMCHGLRIQVWKEIFDGDRESVRKQASEYLLRKLIGYLREVIS
jgi:PncC family amidohydrolase